MEYPKPIWAHEKPERVLDAREVEEGTGVVRLEPSENGPVTFGCAECARLRAWMRDLGDRGDNEETLPKVAEFVTCWKARARHEAETGHVAFGWGFDAYAVSVANKWLDDPTSGPFWREFKAKYLMPKTVNAPG